MISSLCLLTKLFLQILRGQQTLNISENTGFIRGTKNNLQRTMKFNIKFLDVYITKFNAYIPSYARWRGKGPVSTFVPRNSIVNILY